MKIKKYRYFASDFETTVYKKQVATEVWASASVELYTEDVNIFHSLDEQMEYFKSLNCNVVAYFHNLKFDGSFWLPYLLQEQGFKQAYRHKNPDNINDIEWIADKFMTNNTFKYSISSKGQWYTIIIKVNGKYIEIRDSLKLLPYSLERIGHSFKTKHQKLTMKYEGFRYAGCDITPEEKEYIANDVLVLKEALEIMFNENHDKLTIGACCLDEFKTITGKEDYEMFFPDMYDVSIDPELYTYPTAGDYIRKSYKGGWCYLVKGEENKVFYNGTTFDVNSLYPSMMHSESGNRYPVGQPYFWKGDIIPDEALALNRYYFIRIKTRFYLKKDKLPFVQIKSSFLYKGTECLETTDIYNPDTGHYNSHYKKADGTIHDTRVELTLTMTDFKLLKEHYELVDFEILDGCWFYSEIGLFDQYINKYREIKIHSEGALREQAKLFLNNLYGKMASSRDSSFKVAFIKPDGSLGFTTVLENNKKAGYIPVGSAITSYARDFTIRSAQKNYHGKDKAGFKYADTDSIHCDLPPEEVVGIKVHDVNFCCWSLESCWDKAIFTRQKTYIEHIVKQTKRGELVNVKPFYDIKCAGMPQKSKDLFELSILAREHTEEELEVLREKYNEKELNFITEKRDLSHFKVGLEVPGKLRPKRIRGGVILVQTPYKMRG